VIRVLREANAALTAGDVKTALRAGGVAKADADATWPRVQKRLKSHDSVIAEGNRYRWTPKARDVSAEEALDLLVKGRPGARRKAELAAIVRVAIVPATTDQDSRPDRSPDAEAAARQRQQEIDAVRTLAELAIEVEELTANEASASAMIHRVRARVNRSGLEPIDRAGEETTFDRKRHTSIGRPIRDGAPVVVVRPGYMWKAHSEEVLIARPVVEE